VVLLTHVCYAKIVHKRSVRINKVLLTSVKYLLNEINLYLRVKGFHANDALDEDLIAMRRVNGRTAI